MNANHLEIVPETQQSSPHDGELEASILGSVMRSGAIPETIAARLNPDHFFDPRHQRICVAIMEIGADPVTVASALFGSKGLGSYAAELLDVSLPMVGQEIGWLARLETLAVSRELEAEAMVAVDLARDGKPGASHGHIRELATKPLSGPTGVPASKPMTEGAERFIGRAEAYARGECVGWKTGIDMIDNTINSSLGGGIQPGQLGVIAGRPGRGKTSFLLHLLASIVERTPESVMCQMFSLEMTEAEAAYKLLAREVGRGRLEREGASGLMSVDTLRRSQLDISSKLARIWIHDAATLDIDQIIDEADRLMADAQMRIFAVDYIQRIPFDADPEFARHEYGRVTQRLAAHAKDNQCAWIALSQFNRQAESREPTMADLKESGDIEQDAAWILGLHRPFERDTTKLDLLNLKNRFGGGRYWSALKVNWRHQLFENDIGRVEGAVDG